MKRIMIVSLAAVAAWGCRDQQSVVSPGGTAPSFAISDGANGGNEHFFFLPPLVPTPDASGAFNPDLSPIIEICELETSGEGCVDGSPLERFTDVPANSSKEMYLFGWKTTKKNSNLVIGKRYRIRVFIGTIELGFLDIRPVLSPQEVPNVQTGDEYVFLLGRTIPIKFLIERGALCDNDQDCGEGTVGSDGGVVTTQSQQAGVEAFPGSVAEGEEVTIIIEKIDVNVHHPCLPTDLRQFEDCYRFRTEPPLAPGFEAPVTIGVCLDPAGLSEEQQDLLLLHRVTEPFDFSSPVTPLSNVSAGFLECPNQTANVGSNRLLQFARAGMRRLFGVFAPQAHAVHKGLGGSTTTFSRIGWVLPAEMTLEEGDAQTAVVETFVPIAPAVLLSDSTGAPIAGMVVTFTVAGGGGEVTGSVVTGADGIASTPWRLGPVPGTNTLTASARTAVGSPVTFTATGVSED